MGTRLYLLPDEDEDETKVWYPLDLGIRMMMYGNEYEIAQPVLLARSVVIPTSNLINAYIEIFLNFLYVGMVSCTYFVMV